MRKEGTLSHLHTVDTKSYHTGWFGISWYLNGWFGPQHHWCKRVRTGRIEWLMLWPSLIFAPLQKGAVDGSRHPCVAAAAAPTGICLCLTVHEDILTQVPESVRPWLCRLVVHSPGKSQVGKVRQHPPTMSQIDPRGYIISVNRITGLKLCFCSHQCCQFLHCKVGKVSRVGIWSQLQTAVVGELQFLWFWRLGHGHGMYNSVWDSHALEA